MISFNRATFHSIVYELGDHLLNHSRPVDSLTWQSQTTEGRAGMNRTWELEDVMLSVAIPQTPELMAILVKPNLPWADLHFDERVSGLPLNPPPSHELWPYRRQDNAEHLDKNLKFSHTYPERFWPTHAGHTPAMCGVEHRDDTSFCDFGPTMGLRYQYGDLLDLVTLMLRDPLTRQAYLPIWFPEDTGAIHGQRVPCSLGYQFKFRRGQLNCTYFLRSCDYIRHFRDDVYLAMRLTRWIVDRFMEQKIYAVPGSLTMCIGSLHIFEGDRGNMTNLVANLQRELSQAVMDSMR